jgi:hypothetical protein
MPKMLVRFYCHHGLTRLGVDFMSAVNTQNNGLGLLYGIWWKLKNPVHDRQWNKILITCTYKTAEEKLKLWMVKHQDRHYQILPDGETPDED